MPIRPPFLLLLILLGLAILYVVWPEGEPTPGPGYQSQESQSPVAPASDSSLARPISPKREALPIDGTRVATGLDLIQVQVLAQATGEALPGVSVRYLPMDYIAGMSPEELAELAKDYFSIDAIFDRFGASARSDAAGRVNLPKNPVGLYIRAGHDNLVGELIIQAEEEPPAAGWRVELSPGSNFSVEVVDQAGIPQGEIPIAILIETDEGAYPWPLGMTNAADGRFSDSLIEQRIEQIMEFADHPSKPRCIIHLPGLASEGQVLDPKQLPTDPVRLVLQSSGSLRVEVRSSSGDPLTAEVFVTPTRDGPSVPFAQATTDEEGAALFARIGIGQQYRIYANTAQTQTEELLVAGPNRPGEEITAHINLPATGRIVVQLLDPSGQPMDGGHSYVDLFDRESDFETQRPFDKSGRAVFERVPLGREFKAEVYLDFSPVELSILGPKLEGDEVKIEFTAAADMVRLVGLALDENREPLRNHDLGLRVIRPDGGRRSSEQTDEDGRFQIILEPEMADREINFLSLFLGEWDEPSGEEAVLLRRGNLEPGINDFGEVVFKKRPLVLGGQLLGWSDASKDSERPILSIEAMESFTRRGEVQERWTDLPSLTVLALDGGRFEIRGEVESGVLRLVVLTESFLPIDPIPFSLGTADLPVPLVLGGSLQASLLLDPGVPLHALRAELHSNDGQLTTDTMVTSPVEEMWQEPKNQSKVFIWQALKPGPYRLVLGGLSEGDPLAIIDSILVPEGKACDDPRLDGIDLRGTIHALNLIVTNSAGEPIESEGTVLVGPAGSTGRMGGYDLLGGGRVFAAVRSLPARVMIFVEGYRNLEALVPGGEATLSLEPGLDVSLRLRGGGPALPAGASLDLYLRPLTGLPDKDRMYYTAGAVLPEWTLHAGRIESAGYMNGAAQFSVPQPGTYELVAYLTTSGQARRVSFAEPIRIQVADSQAAQTMEIVLPQAAIDLLVK